MPVACWSVIHSSAAHVAQATTRVVRHVTGRVGRHFAHRVVHAAHAVALHPRAWIEMVCRVAPTAIAAAILTVPPTFVPVTNARPANVPVAYAPPTYVLPPAVQSAFITAPQVASPVAGGVPGSVMLFSVPPAVTPPFELPPPNVVSSPPTPPGFTQGAPPQEVPVPEPDSTSVLILAIGGLILISRKRKVPFIPVS
jgi:hypothetical protein